MRESMTREELPLPVFDPTEDAFRVTLYASWEALGLSVQEAGICRWLAGRKRVTAAELASQLGVSKDTAGRLLTRLVGRGLVEIIGKGPATAYILKDSGR